MMLSDLKLAAKSGDLVVVHGRAGNEREYGIIFFIGDEGFVLKGDGHIIAYPNEEYEVEVLCRTSLGFKPELFGSVEEVKENYEEGKYGVVFGDGD